MVNQVKARPAPMSGTCRRCKGPIKAGEPLAASSREFAHVACVRMRVVAYPEGRRFIDGSHVGEPCDGCGREILPDDAVVTVMTVPWHRECRVRR